MTALAERGLRPVAELAATRQHGDRLRYMAGCRCGDCRGANTAYEKQRALARKAGDWNGIVPAARARAHMAELSAVNVGRRTVSDVADVSDTVLADIIAGRKTRIRARTERAILAVTPAAAADHALVPAKPTWKLLRELIKDGWSKAELARQMGYTVPALQLSRKQVTVRNAYDVQQLHARLQSCAASASLSLLAELREEGFPIKVIEQRLALLATEAGGQVPDLTVRNGRIRADAAKLLARVHAQLTE
ncbi:MAG TPA: hypothetical protein VE934_12165 [Polaromonas sp.]|uniref:hypothetical protein n=1 Tax=Polaromonas sp. TaxID=1869339 RepID=UPI002D38829B|nr:hypothetical protein [Polaromonas sp.]HYW57711.1 hypothetical protein [Polaromonas sp.]